MTTEPTKTCKICDQVKPLSLFGKFTKMADGHLNQCKSCINKRNCERNELNREFKRAQAESYRRRDGQMTKAEFHAKLKENKQPKSEVARKSNEKNKARIQAYRKAYAEANRERLQIKNALNKDRKREWQRQYIKANPGHAAAYVAKRNAAKLQRTPAWLTEFDLLKIKCLYQLAAMRNRESGESWHVDHIIPLQGAFVSGLHVPGNLRVIPAVDNRRKSNQYEV
jgi:hypothetical protein